MIPHKVLNIRCYICTYLALFFIFVFIRLLEYQILQFHTFFLPITHRSGVDTVQYDCAMKIQNLCVHQTNGVTDYYSAELVGNKQHLSVKFFINAGGGGIVAYNSNDDLIYQVQSINGIRNIDISTWRNGDEIELCPQQGIKRDN